MNSEQETIEDFDIHHQEILGKYYDSEEFLPSDDVVYTVVVPTSAELTNGNFWRMVESLTELDEETDMDEFEVLCIINNLEPEKNKVRYLENQIHLEILGHYGDALISGDRERFLEECEAVGLDEYLIDLLEVCLDRNIRLHGVDASSDSKHITFGSEFDYAPGHARNISGHIATERMEDNSETDGFIDYKDADVSFPPNFFLEDHIHTTAEAMSFPVDMTFALFPEFDTEKWSELDDIKRTIDYYVAELLSGNKGALSYIPRDYQTSKILLDMRRYKEGPQLAVSGEIFQETEYPVAGYKGEDYQAVYDTKKVIGESEFADVIPIIALVPDKYDTASLLNWDLINISQSIEDHSQDKVNGFLWNMAELYRVYKSNEAFGEILDEQFLIEVERRQQSLNDLEDIIDYLYGAGEGIHTENRVAYLVKQYSSLIFLIEKLRDEENYSEAEVFKFFQEEFPALFGEIAEEPDYEALELLIDSYPEGATGLNPRDFMHVLRSAYLAEVEETK